MQIEIKIDEKRKEPKIIVMTDKMTDEVNAIIKRVSDEQPQVIAGFREDVVEVLDPSEIYRVFAESGKVFAETNHGEYALRLRLYEAEQRLDNKTFVRISNSDIINLRKVKSFDLSFVGTICITLSNGTVTYVSRRSVAKIKQLLGLRGGRNEEKTDWTRTTWFPCWHCNRICHYGDYLNLHWGWFLPPGQSRACE